MSYIKSYAVGNGDMFFINDCEYKVIIDCNLVEEAKEQIVSELCVSCGGCKNVFFISTHPDKDHIFGLDILGKALNFNKIYMVQNNIMLDNNPYNNAYKIMRDASTKISCDVDIMFSFHQCFNYGENQPLISFIWPNVNNVEFKKALKKANSGIETNNICPIIKYTFENGFTVVWFGDLQEFYLDAIQDYLLLGKADIVFAPHHGRKTGKIPNSLLYNLNPKIIVVGEGESASLCYYKDYNTITQNSAKTITILANGNCLNFYSSNINYQCEFLSKKENYQRIIDGNYFGSLSK